MLEEHRPNSLNPNMFQSHIVSMLKKHNPLPHCTQSMECDVNEMIC